MRDHKEVVQSILEKTALYEKKKTEREAKMRRMIPALAVVLVGVSVFTFILNMKPNNRIISEKKGENVFYAGPTESERPTDRLAQTSPEPQLTEILQEAEKHRNIYNVSEIDIAENYIIADFSSEKVRLSCSVQKALLSYDDDDLFFPIKIVFVLAEAGTDGEKRCSAEKEKLIKKGIVIVRDNGMSVDVLINETQICDLLPTEKFYYELFWTR